MTFKSQKPPGNQTRKPSIVIPFAQVKRELAMAETMILPPEGRTGQLVDLNSHKRRRRKEEMKEWIQEAGTMLLDGYVGLIDKSRPRAMFDVHTDRDCFGRPSRSDPFATMGYLENVTKEIETIERTDEVKTLLAKIAELSPHENIKGAARRRLAS